MTEEIWKDIYDKGNKIEDYQISNKGRVKRLGKYIYWNNSKYPNRSKAKRFIKEAILNPIDCSGYLTVILYRKHYRVHRLVALHFIKNDKNYPIVNHIDSNTYNNNFENLEWCTHRHNNIHYVKSIMEKDNKITTKEKVLQIKDELLSGKSVSDISKITGVSYYIIHNIKNGKSWSWLTGFVRNDISIKRFRQKLKELNEQKTNETQFKSMRKVQNLQTKQIFDSIKSASRFINRSHQSLDYALKNKTKCAGYNWEYLD